MPKRKGSTNATGSILRDLPVNASQTIVAGDPLVLSSGKASLAGAAAGAGTFLGYANTDITTGVSVDGDDVVAVDINPAGVYTYKYTGSSKTSLTNEDIGTAFDLTDHETIDLDDTTGGYLIVVGYDNDADTADCIVKSTIRAI